VHKRRCKELKEPAYTIEEAEKAAGLGREGKRPTVLRDGVMAGIS
jgi:bud site selection protein 20